MESKRGLEWKAIQAVILEAGSDSVARQHVDNSAERTFILTNIE